MNQQQGRLRNVGCVVRCIVFFHFRSQCLQLVFWKYSHLLVVFFAPPFSVDVSQPVKAVDPCRQVEMQIVMYARTGKERKSAT